MKSAKDLALISALAALAIAAIRLALLFASAQHVVEQVPAIINLQAEETRGALVQAVDQLGLRAESQITLTRVAAVREIQASRRVLSGDLGALAGVADSRIASVQSDLNQHGLILERLTARELGRAVDGWVTVAQPAGVLARQLATAAPALLDPLTDCEDNPSCFENRWRGLTFDLEQTMRAVQQAAPRVGNAAGEISGHAANIAGSVDRWVGRQLAPKSKGQTALAVIERFGLIGIRAWLLL